MRIPYAPGVAMRDADGGLIEVTAAEASRQFAKWSEVAVKTPVAVTRHGRPRIVMISADRYEAQAQDGGDIGSNPASLAQIALVGLLDHTAEGFFACDATLRISAVNAVFKTLVAKTAQQLIGRSLEAVFPPTQAAMLQEHLLAVADSGEATELELRDDHRILLVRAFPYLNGVAALILNRSRELTLQRRSARQDARSKALAAMPGLASIELNLRGAFEQVDAGFCLRTGFCQAELKQFRLAEIVHPRHRSQFNIAFERAVQGDAGAISTILLAKGGAQTPVTLAVSQVTHQGLPEAIVVLARFEGD